MSRIERNLQPTLLAAIMIGAATAIIAWIAIAAMQNHSPAIVYPMLSGR